MSVSRKTVYQRFWEKVKVGDPTKCWDWKAAINANGYGSIGVGKKVRSSNRVAFEFCGGVIPDGKCICHHCDNRKCCNPNHLYAGTVAQNNRDIVDRNRRTFKKGSEHYRSRFSNEQIHQIRQRSKDGESAHVMGREFGVNFSTICRIVTRRTWKHI